MIHDLDFICPDDIDIALPVAPAGLFHVHLEGGISTRLYLSMLKYYQQTTGNHSNVEATEQLKDIALKIIREDQTHKDMSRDYFDMHLNHYPVLKALVSTVYHTMGELYNQPGLTLPQIMNNRGEAESTDEQEVMKDIAFVMTHKSMALFALNYAKQRREQTRNALQIQIANLDRAIKRLEGVADT